MTPAPVSLAEVAAFAPARARTVEQVAPALGLRPHQARLLRRAHGFGQLRVDPDLGVLDMILRSASAVLRPGQDPKLIRYLVLAHTALEIAPAHIDAAAQLAERLGLGHAEAFALTNQYCASGLAAMDAAAELLRDDGDPRARALVLTGEKALPALAAPLARSTLIGEASAAVQLRLGGQADWIRSYVTMPHHLALPAETLLSAQAMQHFTDGYPDGLATVMTAAAAQAGLAMDQITMIVPHNVSRMAWRRIAGRLGVGQDRIFLANLPEYGHTYCCDPLLNLATLRTRQRLVKGGFYLLTSVGIGGAYAAMVIEH